MAVLADHEACGALLELDDVRQALGLVEQSYLGVRAVPVGRIVGTVGRCGDFDRCFHPLRPDLEERMSRVSEVFPDHDFPPVDLLQIDEALFVADGHHRVALARQAGVDYIDAVITQIHGPYRLGTDVDRTQIELTGRERRFLSDSGLAAARPAARVCLSSPTSYSELLEVVKAHGYDLIQQEGLLLTPGQVAAHWHDCVFRPTLETAERTGLSRLLPSCLDGDIFLCLHRSDRSVFGTEGAAAEEATRQVAQAARDSLSSERPRLLRRLLPFRHAPQSTPPPSPLQRRQ